MVEKILSPKISVILTTHNSEKYVKEALESVVSQTLTDIEIICIDSSSDGTPRILEEAAEKDSRLKIIFDKNGSYGHKINVGICEAKGEYIAILESDDRYEKGALWRLYGVALEYDKPDYIKGDYCSFHEESGRLKKLHSHHFSEDMYNRLVDFQNERQYWMGSWNHIWTGIYRADFLRNNGIILNESSGASYQDTGFSVLCNVYAKDVVFIHDTVYMYRTDNEDSSVKSDDKYSLIIDEFNWIENQLRIRNLYTKANKKSLDEFKRNTYKWNRDRLSDEYKCKFSEAVIANDKYDIKVSVLLPTLNVKPYIKQCLESVISQTLKKIEIICIDAGSTDGTLKVIEEYADRDSRIRVINADRKSYGYQMNLGIAKARGEYVGIVETDDFIEDKMFETLYNTARWYDVDVAKSLAYDTYDYGKDGFAEVPVSYIADNDKIGNVFYPEDYAKVHIWDGNIWNGIYRKAFLDNTGIRFRQTQGAAYQDIGFQQRILNDVESMICIPNLFYHYRKVRLGASTLSENCISYFYGEYRNLIEKKIIKESRLKAVYGRMLPAFFDELEKMLTFYDFDYSRIKDKEAIKWFSEQAVYAFENNLIVQNDIDAWNYYRFEIFLEGIEHYVNWWREELQSAKKWYKGFVDRIRDRRLVIFGCGNYGMTQLKVNMRNGHVPIAMCDNSLQHWSRTYFGVPVMSPEDVVVSFNDAFFLIASKSGGQSMKEQLKSLGILEEQIMIYDGSDEKIRDTLRREPIFYGL